MKRQTFWIVFLVSLSHAMVHTFELVFPAIEQALARDWELGTRVTGRIAMLWALPFGMGAIFAGWLADKIGSKIVLILYLLGAAGTCVGVGFAPNVIVLTTVMFAMGSFASLYHPAGLAYISRISDPKDVGEALGLHGIVGALGIAGAPLLAGTLLQWMSWNWVYVSLAPAGVFLALLFWVALPADSSPKFKPADASAHDSNWLGFAAVCGVTMLFGMIYRGFVTFLPRYLSEAGLQGLGGLSTDSIGGYLTAGVLFMGIVGQYGGGRLCGRVNVEKLLVVVMLANIPFLLWMGMATGPMRVVATGLYAMVHFMMQPVGNMLIASYSPVHRRSLAYGINFFLSFGVGSLGAGYAGLVAQRWEVSAIYPGMALLALFAVALGLVVVALSMRPKRPDR